MSEKRFIADNECVIQEGEVYVVCKGEHNADVVATALNELLNENEQLKQVMKELKGMLQEDVDNGIRSYPKQLSEYLISALSKIGGV